MDKETMIGIGAAIVFGSMVGSIMSLGRNNASLKKENDFLSKKLKALEKESKIDQEARVDLVEVIRMKDDEIRKLEVTIKKMQQKKNPFITEVDNIIKESEERFKPSEITAFRDEEEGN
jgi:seryl-tRNA synthetase